MYNSKEPRNEKKKQKVSPSSWCLPDDVVMNCLARVRRLDHPALSLVSKSNRSLVASSDLYKTRSLMGLTETSVYVCLRTPLDTKPRWYILGRRRTSLDAFELTPIPWNPSQPEEASSVVVLDWGIYVLGGWVRGKKCASSDVWLLDCRTHTWRQLPSMRVARSDAAAGVVDGKIYVLGGCPNTETCIWGEVFDPKTQTWDCLPKWISGGQRNIHDSVVRDQKVYGVGGMDKTFYYSPREGQWGIGNHGQTMGNLRDWCMVDNLICCLGRDGNIYWYDPDELDRREPEGMMMNTKVVKGLGLSFSIALCFSRLIHFSEQSLSRWEKILIKRGRMRPFNRDHNGVSYELEDLLPGARLSNFGGNLVLFWDAVKEDCLEIWCTEISLERRQGGEVWGNIEWSNVVMTVDPFVDRYKVLHSVSVTL